MADHWTPEEAYAQFAPLINGAHGETVTIQGPEESHIYPHIRAENYPVIGFHLSKGHDLIHDFGAETAYYLNRADNLTQLDVGTLDCIQSSFVSITQDVTGRSTLTIVNVEDDITSDDSGVFDGTKLITTNFTTNNIGKIDLTKADINDIMSTSATGKISLVDVNITNDIIATNTGEILLINSVSTSSDFDTIGYARLVKHSTTNQDITTGTAVDILDSTINVLSLNNVDYIDIKSSNIPITNITGNCKQLITEDTNVSNLNLNNCKIRLTNCTSNNSIFTDCDIELVNCVLTDVNFNNCKVCITDGSLTNTSFFNGVYQLTNVSIDTLSTTNVQMSINNQLIEIGTFTGSDIVIYNSVVRQTIFNNCVVELRRGTLENNNLPSPDLNNCSFNMHKINLSGTPEITNSVGTMQQCTGSYTSGGGTQSPAPHHIVQ